MMVTDESQRPEGGSGASANTERRGYKKEFRHPRCRKLFKVQTLNDVNPAFYEQMNVNRHFGTRSELKGRGVASRGEDPTPAQPAGGLKRGAGTPHLVYKPGGIIPVLAPACADKRHIAWLTLKASRFQMLGSNGEIVR